MLSNIQWSRRSGCPCNQVAVARAHLARCVDGEGHWVMQVCQVDDSGSLFISPAIDEWAPVGEHGIDTVIDLDGGLDHCIPTVPNQVLYLYYPIYDEDLPDLDKLGAVADLAANLIRSGHRVLSHCGMGFNRSALVAGLTLCRLGMTGVDAVARLRACRPGALFNERFAEFLLSVGDVPRDRSEIANPQ